MNMGLLHVWAGALAAGTLSVGTLGCSSQSGASSGPGGSSATGGGSEEGGAMSSGSSSSGTTGAAGGDAGSSAADDAQAASDDASSVSSDASSDAATTTDAPALPSPDGGALIDNDRFWKDTTGTPLYSQGGGVLQVGSTYYTWYGVKYGGAPTCALQTPQRARIAKLPSRESPSTPRRIWPPGSSRTRSRSATPAPGSDAWASSTTRLRRSTSSWHKGRRRPLLRHQRLARRHFHVQQRPDELARYRQRRNGRSDDIPGR